MAGSDIICLHGLGRSSADWDAVHEGLAAFGHVSAPDLPKSGRADSFPAWDLRPGTILVGHSLGAVLALRLASVSPSVRGLILTSGFYPPGRNNQSYVSAFGSYLRHRVAVAKTMASDGARPRPSGARALAPLVGMGLRPTRFYSLAAKIDVPVLVVHGDHDHHVPIDFMLAATDRYPTWHVSVMAGGGHHMHVDRPTDWIAITGRWLHAFKESPG